MALSIHHLDAPAADECIAGALPPRYDVATAPQLPCAQRTRQRCRIVRAALRKVAGRRRSVLLRRWVREPWAMSAPRVENSGGQGGCKSTVASLARTRGARRGHRRTSPGRFRPRQRHGLLSVSALSAGVSSTQSDGDGVLDDLHVLALTRRGTSSCSKRSGGALARYRGERGRRAGVVRGRLGRGKCGCRARLGIELEAIPVSVPGDCWDCGKRESGVAQSAAR
jgi:hypothetical protein